MGSRRRLPAGRQRKSRPLREPAVGEESRGGTPISGMGSVAVVLELVGTLNGHVDVVGLLLAEHR
jgi:hypothetical protein